MQAHWMSSLINLMRGKERPQRSSASANVRTPSIFTRLVDPDADADADEWSPSLGRSRIELPYKAVDGGGVCPAAPIHPISGNGAQLPAIVAIVDSGADWSTFPSAYAAHLGIELEDCLPSHARTAGGVTENHHYKPGIDILLEDEKLKIAANFCTTLKVPVLGRKDFFAAYAQVIVDERREIVTLEPFETEPSQE